MSLENEGVRTDPSEHSEDTARREIAIRRLVDMTRSLWNWVENMDDVRLAFESAHRSGVAAYNLNRDSITDIEAVFCFHGFGDLLQMVDGLPGLHRKLIKKGLVEFPPELARFGPAERPEANTKEVPRGFRSRNS